ncbi:MAG: ABC transporter ATP-binding protein, partial [Deltaproteobacteria bacterium]|nr:ABC transporter ATP-binding protein [Deltaproteobacteria bacterium]
WILKSSTASVDKGTVYGILGPNGCGKTTLLKLILGEFKAMEGRVAVYGQTAFVPQLFQAAFSFTALDMVLMGLTARMGFFGRPGRADREAAWAAMEKLGVADLAARTFHELSGGQRQLTILARALVSEAEILVMDEPTSALDLKNQSLVMDWMVRLSEAEGLTVIFTTHQPHHALAVSEKVFLMMGPGEYLEGPVNEILTEDNLESLYGVPIQLVKYERQGESFSTVAPVFQPRKVRRGDKCQSV